MNQYIREMQEARLSIFNIPGVHYIIDFSVMFQIRRKYCLMLIQILVQ